ncbi:MAG: hypothetical protein EXR40_05960 [Nitrosomonadaceae bacterium]|nr:hypothetical protein [Nitrosomonadaceae bacterium]
MTTQENNPLSQFFRKSGVNVELPSKGQFYKNPPKMSVDGEVSVFPMTAKDELLVKNADSLLNGDAIIHLIRSCVPDIYDPQEMPNPDVDAVLLAIRKATYGDKMDVSGTCPCMEWSGTYQISVDQLLVKLKPLNEINEVELDNGLKVRLKPSTLADQNTIGLVQFENVRKLQAVANNEDELVRIATNNEVTNRNIVLAQDIITRIISSIITPSGDSVNEPSFIKEWLSQLETLEFKKIEDKIKDINQSGAETRVEVKCGKEGCDRNFDLEFTLDPVSFFAQGS